MERGAQRVEVPRAFAAAHAADKPSSEPYVSAFALPLGGSTAAAARDRRSAEQWARAVFEGAPSLLRSCMVLGWRFFLGLRLRPTRGSDQVLGWRLARGAAGPDSVTLAADSPLLQAENIVAVDGTVVLWVTVVRFENRIGRLLWGAASLVHHLTIPYLLARAGRQP